MMMMVMMIILQHTHHTAGIAISITRVLLAGKPVENKITIQMLISLSRVPICCGPHIQENSERMIFPNGTGRAWITVIVLSS